LDFRLDRKNSFSFACRACGHCCAGKVIMVGPHEVLGMARALGITTTEFLERYTENGGTTLRFGTDGHCVFVTAAGCRVHPRRPLVCRLYPLGRMVDDAGEERFALFPQEPGCGAETGGSGTVESFLESQDVGPYFEWSRSYGLLYRRMIGLLDRLGVEGRVEVSAVERPGGRPARPAHVDPEPLSSWQDIDAAKGIVVPAGIEEAIDLHLTAMLEWLDGLEARVGPAPGDPEGANEP
jgi:Fe-S-cluster containining protein